MNRLPTTKALTIGALAVCVGVIALAFAADGTRPAAGILVQGDRGVASGQQNLLQIDSAATSSDWQKLLAESSSSKTPSSEGLTDKVSKQLFSSILGLQQSGLIDDPASQDQIVQQALSLAQGGIVGTQYTLSDLTTTEETATLLNTYASNLRTTLVKTLDVKESELNIFARASNDKSATELKQLDQPIQIYEGIVHDLLGMPVPKGATSAHLALVNAFSNLAQSLKTMEELFTDPLGAATSIKGLPAVETAIQQAVKNLSSYLSARHVAL